MPGLKIRARKDCFALQLDDCFSHCYVEVFLFELNEPSRSVSPSLCEFKSLIDQLSSTTAANGKESYHMLTWLDNQTSDASCKEDCSCAVCVQIVRVSQNTRHQQQRIRNVHVANHGV